MTDVAGRVPRFVVIGAGDFGRVHLQVYQQIEARGEGRLVGLATRSEASAASHGEMFGVPGFTDYEAMLSELCPDAVSIVTPDDLHCEMTCHALSAGLHVLVEKPMDTSIAGARTMLEAARTSGRLLQVDHHKRFDPSVVEARRLVQAGGIGQPVYGYAFLEERITLPRDVIGRWVTRTNPNWLVGIHIYDVLRWVLGREVRRVFATACNLNLDGLGPDTIDAVQARLEFDHGAQVEVQTSWILPETFPAMVDQSLRLVGTQGVAEVDLRRRGVTFCGAEGVATPNPHFLQPREAPFGKTETFGYGAASIESFARNVRALLGGASLDDLDGPWANAADGLAATQIAAAVDRSFQTGQPVDVQDMEEA